MKMEKFWYIVFFFYKTCDYCQGKKILDVIGCEGIYQWINKSEGDNRVRCTECGKIKENGGLWIA